MGPDNRLSDDGHPRNCTAYLALRPLPGHAPATAPTKAPTDGRQEGSRRRRCEVFGVPCREPVSVRPFQWTAFGECLDVKGMANLDALDASRKASETPVSYTHLRAPETR